MKKFHATVQFSLYMAIVSFATAIAILAGFFFTGSMGFAFVGYICMIVFVLLNATALIVVNVAMYKGKVSGKHGAFAIAAQLANIPVAIFCMWAGMCLMNIARVTFVNETGTQLQNVRILGCEESVIENLEPDESELVWISIPHDCSIRIEYMQNDSVINRPAYGYLTPGMGIAYTYNIGGENGPESR